MNILITDDETTFRRTLRTTLETMGHAVAEARHSSQALEILSNRVIDLAFLDLRLAAEKGLDLLPEMLRLAPTLDVVIITAYATVETAVEAMRLGAFDYMPKPFTPDQLRLVLERIARARRLQTQVKELEAQVASVVPEVDLKSEEPAVRQALDIALKAAASEATILLRGESGTGKGVLARIIHAHSKRAQGPFVTVNCPNLSAELLESEMFGHVRGSFTGAIRDTIGKVANADQGTLFLDEIGDLPIAMQPKLLRLLQEKCYERVGENRDTKVGCAHRGGHESQSRSGRDGREVPRRSALSAQGDRSHPAAAASTPARYSGPGLSSAQLLRPPDRQIRDRVHARKPAPFCCAIPGPATSANCAMPSNGASSWPRRRWSALPICRPRSERRFPPASKSAAA